MKKYIYQMHKSQCDFFTFDFSVETIVYQAMNVFIHLLINKVFKFTLNIIKLL